MNSINKECSLRELMVKNNICLKKQIYVEPINTIGIGKRVNFPVYADLYGSEPVDLMTNPVIIFELNNKLDLEFDVRKIIQNITLEIGGLQIEKMYNNTIMIYQKIYDLEPKHIGSKVFFPIPFDCLLKFNGIIPSKCKLHEIRFLIEFTSNTLVDCIDYGKIRFDLDIFAIKPDYTKICGHYVKKLLTSYIDNKYKKSFQGDYDLAEFQITEFRHTCFHGNELIGFGTVSDNMIYKYCKPILDEQIERFIIYFENIVDNNIYKSKPFGSVIFWINNENVLEIDYETLVYENSESNLGHKLPNGVYEIVFKNIIKYVPEQISIEFRELEIPSDNICLAVVGEMTNYLIYGGDKCGLMIPS
jgi:hypothetical protein